MAVKSATASTKGAPPQAAAKKAASATTTAKKTTAKKTTAKKTTAKKTSAPETPAGKTPAAKGPVGKAPVAKTTAAKVPAAASAAKKSPAKKSPARKAPVVKASAAKATTTAKAAASSPATEPPARGLKVRADEAPWTPAELASVRGELEHDVARLEAEIGVAETGLAHLMQDAGASSGDDEADAGAKTFEREQEISLANNSREMLEQSLHALHRLADGTYGLCESCGNPVGKLRLQAFPRATLCLTCKQKQERR